MIDGAGNTVAVGTDVVQTAAVTDARDAADAAGRVVVAAAVADVPETGFDAHSHRRAAAETAADADAVVDPCRAVTRRRATVSTMRASVWRRHSLGRAPASVSPDWRSAPANGKVSERWHIQTQKKYTTMGFVKYRLK